MKKKIEASYYYSRNWDPIEILLELALIGAKAAIIVGMSYVMLVAMLEIMIRELPTWCSYL